MKYLTKEGEQILNKQIFKSYEELEIIQKCVEPGHGIWTAQKRYIDGLEFLIDMEVLNETKNR
jgi:hypothetical protein